ncbi:MAG: hypothetical protein A2W93_14460 [Bacteroidetes bacterium GWF2_43_63]|nr:MAG: hypothetical protein A2W94_01030 [Bacteroidetes bacterium GWE2_42_42]OFY52543.1 MAG: hypothetical protein A2W93_14460 [Bacteroidetes bacterium GWF2_43_63]HBG71451.1 hypothetical protein [Bacteroidales bacterium]HCB60797.1 hypothetical protein [Bacteroidales bacterium]HCY23478.1 hypothetical protein [Bacteroidales bacterium]
MSEPLTDKSIMPFGQFFDQKKTMAEVPTWYLKWLKKQYETNGCRGEVNERVKQYIDEYWDAIEIEHKKQGGK